MEILEKRQDANFPAMLQRYQKEIGKALPKHLNADRITRIALTSFRKNPKLGQCDPRSVFAAVLQAAQLGWEIGINGQAYLVPYGKECQLIPGWMGLVELVHRAGRASVWTGAVYEGDLFSYSLGDSPFLNHRPKDPGSDNLTTVYAVGRIVGNEWPVIEAWPVAKVIAHRDRYNKVGKLHYSYQNFEMYARKVPLMQVLKYMPKSTELNLAMALDHSASTGSQRLDVHEVLDATWVPEQVDEPVVEPPTPQRSATEEVKEQLKGAKAARISADEIWPRKDEPPRGDAA